MESKAEHTARLVSDGLQHQRPRHPGSPAGRAPVCLWLRSILRFTIGCVLPAICNSATRAGLQTSGVLCRRLIWTHFGRPVGRLYWLRC